MYVLKLLSRLPLSVLYLLSDGLYLFIYHVWRFRRDLTLANLRASFPGKPAAELEPVARESYRNACNLMAEVLKGAAIDREELRGRIQMTNVDSVKRCLASGQSVVLLASHHCNWEWLLLAGCFQFKTGIDAVYKPLRVKAMDRFMLATRSRFGGHPVAVKNILREVLKRCGAPRIYALIVDQTPPQAAAKYWTHFLGQDTAFFIGADRIARITQSPVFFVSMRRLRRGYYEASFEPLAQPPYAGENADVIERYARMAEAHIARYPADWLWMYRKWKYKKPPDA